jgi:hypothetical protein
MTTKERLALLAETKVKIAITAGLSVGYLVAVVGLSFALASFAAGLGWFAALVLVGVPLYWLYGQVNDEIINARTRREIDAKAEPWAGPAPDRSM